MLSHICNGPESSRIKVMRVIPMNGKKPKIRLISLYLPVRCIIHLALMWITNKMTTTHQLTRQTKTQWTCIRCSALDVSLSISQIAVNAILKRININIPAVDALVRATVWNHIGKKYITEKLQNATRKLLAPTRTGTFCFNRNGAMMGSGATNNSTKMKTTEKMPTRASGTYTHWSDHCRRVNQLDVSCEQSLTGRSSLYFILKNTKHDPTCKESRTVYTW